jgi:alpha-galactosidase
MTANCWAIRQATGVPVVGLCHGTFHVEAQLASFIGALPEEVTSLYAGLNHLTFIYDLRWRGADAWPLVRERVAAELGGDAEQAPEGRPFPVAENPFSWSLYQAYGAYPACNDRHVTEFFPERFPGGRYEGRTLGVDAFSFEGTIAHGDEVYARMRAQALGRQPLDERIFNRGSGEHEQLLAILRSIWGDTRRLFAANLPNCGTVAGLPDEAILELPCVATGRGLAPLQRAELSAPLTAILARKLAATRLTVEAALKGDRGLFVEALLADGGVLDPDVARELGDALLDAQGEYLGNWGD